MSVFYSPSIHFGNIGEIPDWLRDRTAVVSIHQPDGEGSRVYKLSRDVVAHLRGVPPEQADEYIFAGAARDAVHALEMTRAAEVAIWP